MRRVLLSFTGMAGLLGLLCLSLSTAMAGTIRFDVSFSGSDSGWIDIDSSFVSAEASIASNLVQASFTVGGTTYSHSQVGASAFFIIDSGGTRIAELSSPGPGRYIPFGINATSSQTLNLSEGTVPGNFLTRNVPSGNLTGTFSIGEGYALLPPDPSPVPLPATGWVLGLALFGLGVVRAGRGA